MPSVGGKKYPYTAKGMKDAKRAAIKQTMSKGSNPPSRVKKTY
jgi:hypothetical protein